MSKTYTLGTVTTSRIHGPLRMEARIHPSGLFAIHPTILNGALWTVTHVPTGHALTMHARNQTVAKRVIKLALSSQVDWTRPDVTYYEDRAHDVTHAAFAKRMREVLSAAQ